VLDAWSAKTRSTNVQDNFLSGMNELMKEMKGDKGHWP